ncbi:hypothetical protein HanXRQr2_Chr06g0257681 [Helianthus annuus]|uniref:Uncharacterized protein n=1 Tax=Helianthus annuus TaxID=4232 RepID=A0A9K3ITA5_HELAN|nr:hypothetical protein HanXRQr2_Chr06g0257681 [Helianthus annuus]
MKINEQSLKTHTIQIVKEGIRTLVDCKAIKPDGKVSFLLASIEVAECSVHS